MKLIYLLIKYIKSVLWRVAKRLSYTEDARCLKVKLVADLCTQLHSAGRNVNRARIDCQPSAAHSDIYQNCREP